jgi:hypothetical protein
MPVQRTVEKVLRAEIQKLQHSLPPNVGYSSANAIIITDALGEVLILPWSIVSSFQVRISISTTYTFFTEKTNKELQGILMKHFRGKVGGQRVASGHFCVLRANGGKPIKGEEWDNVTEAGERLIMCIVVEQVWVREVAKLCPKCGRTRLGTYKERGWLIW